MNNRATPAISVRRRSSFAAACVSLSLAAGLWSTAARANLGDNEDGGWTARFDLGIDVSDVGHSRNDVRSFMSTLAPETQAVIVTGCQHYMLNPNAVRSGETLPFCRMAVTAGVVFPPATGQTTVFGFLPGLAPAVAPVVVPQERERYRVYPGDETIKPED